MTLREAAQRALEVLTTFNADDSVFKGEFDQEITALRTALAEPEQTFMAEYKHRTYGYYQDADGKMQLGEVPQRTEPVQEPVAWIQSDHLQKARQAPFLCRVEPTQRCADFLPLYTHPVDDTALLRQALDALESDPNAMVEVEPAQWEYKRVIVATALRERLEVKV
jgi:hypothetical protein